MKVVRTAAHARLQSPAYVTTYRWEREILYTLSMMAWRVYDSLLALSDFTSGDVATSYAQLLALITPDQPATGPRLAAPTLKQIRTALDELVAVDLVKRNTAINRTEAKLSLHVEPRKTAAALNANLGREQGRVEKGKKFLKLNRLERVAHRNRAGNRAGVSEGFSITTPPPQNSGELSTGQGPTPPEPDEPPGPISLARGDQKNGPPRGPDSRPAQAGHAPPVSPTTQAMRERLRKTASAPPGGQADAPPGEAPPPSARIRRPRNTVLKDEAATSGKASAPAGHPAEPPEGPQGRFEGVGNA